MRLHVFAMICVFGVISVCGVSAMISVRGVFFKKPIVSILIS